MKKFIKYKGFLPPRYVDEKISKNKKNNKKAIWMLVILNFYMLPVNFRNVLKETNDEKIVNITYYNENEKLNKVQQINMKIMRKRKQFLLQQHLVVLIF